MFSTFPFTEQTGRWMCIIKCIEEWYSEVRVQIHRRISPRFLVHLQSHAVAFASVQSRFMFSHYSCFTHATLTLQIVWMKWLKTAKPQSHREALDEAFSRLLIYYASCFYDCCSCLLSKPAVLVHWCTCVGPVKCIWSCRELNGCMHVLLGQNNRNTVGTS